MEYHDYFLPLRIFFANLSLSSWLNNIPIPVMLQWLLIRTELSFNFWAMGYSIYSK